MIKTYLKDKTQNRNRFEINLKKQIKKYISNKIILILI